MKAAWPLASSHAWAELAKLAPQFVIAAAALCAAADPAGAQQDEAATPLGPIVVTGTHVRDRTELNSTAPVDVLTADDLRAVAGPEANLGQALQALLPSFNYLDQSNSGTADHVRAGQLRGLNPDQILVLIDGKRVHPTSIVNVESTVGLGAVAVDFASIPVNAVKRVEVLRDGAGAQYGSDAIAGVINVILDDSRSSGGELQVNTGLYHTNFAPTDRIINDGQTVNLQAKYGLAMDNDGFVHFGLDATNHEPTNRAGFDQFNPTPDLVTFRVGDAKIENLNLWANSSVPLAGGATGYSVMLFNRRNSYGDAFFREPNDLVNNVPAVYPNGFLPQSTGRNEDWHLSAGIRGNLAGPWNYDGSLTYGLNRFAYGLSDSLNASFGPQSPTNFNLGGFRFTQATANYDVTGQVGWLGLASPSTVAYGVEFRRETYGTTAGDPDSYLTGTVNPGGVGGSQGDGGLMPSEVSQTSRNVAGVYADVSGDIVSSVFADAGARFDHYTGVGSAVTGKLSARWEFVSNWALRGAVSNNFRAPALAQISSAYSPTEYVNGGGLGTVYIVPVSNPAAVSLGAQPLKPERSKNYSLGLAAQPLAQLQFTADVFRININDRIALSQELTPTSGPYAGETFQFFTNVVDTTTHGAELVGAWSQKLAGGILRLSDASMWTTNAIRDIHAPPAQVSGLPNTTSAGLLFGLQAQNAITTAVPKHRDVVSVNWAGNGEAHTWNLLARVTYSGQVTRVFDFGGGDTPMQTYGGTTQLDLEAEWRATRDLALALGSTNLTDRYPTMSNAAINYGGNLPYDFLSPIGFNGRYLYARLRYELH